MPLEKGDFIIKIDAEAYTKHGVILPLEQEPGVLFQVATKPGPLSDGTSHGERVRKLEPTLHLVR